MSGSDVPEDLSELISTAVESDREEGFWHLLIDVSKGTLDRQSQIIEGIRSDAFELIKINLIVSSATITLQQSGIGFEGDGSEIVGIAVVLALSVISIYISWTVHVKASSSHTGPTSEDLAGVFDDDITEEQVLQIVSLGTFGQIFANREVVGKMNTRMTYAMAAVFGSFGALFSILLF